MGARMMIYAGRAARGRFQLPLCPFPHFTSRRRAYPSERAAAAGPSPRCKNRRRRHYIRTRVTYCFKMHRKSTAAVAAAAHVKPKSNDADPIHGNIIYRGRTAGRRWLRFFPLQRGRANAHTHTHIREIIIKK